MLSGYRRFKIHAKSHQRPDYTWEAMAPGETSDHQAASLVFPKLMEAWKQHNYTEELFLIKPVDQLLPVPDPSLLPVVTPALLTIKETLLIEDEESWMRLVIRYRHREQTSTTGERKLESAERKHPANYVLT